MNAKKRKSRKRSEANSDSRPSEPVLFLDRNLGKHTIAERLRQRGQQVETHDDHLPIDAPDADWIALVAANGWLAVTKDKNIRYRIAEIEAIRSCGARVLVVRAKNATGNDIADLLIAHLEKVAMYARTVPAPFVIGIDRSGKLTEY